MIVKDQSPETIAIRLYDRWRKRIFANDNVSYKKGGEGYWEVIITRGTREYVLTLSPQAYCYPNLMLDADDFMRGMLKQGEN